MPDPIRFDPVRLQKIDESFISNYHDIAEYTAQVGKLLGQGLENLGQGIAKGVQTKIEKGEKAKDRCLEQARLDMQNRDKQDSDLRLRTKLLSDIVDDNNRQLSEADMAASLYSSDPEADLNSPAYQSLVARRGELEKTRDENKAALDKSMRQLMIGMYPNETGGSATTGVALGSALLKPGTYGPDTKTDPAQVMVTDTPSGPVYGRVPGMSFRVPGDASAAPAAADDSSIPFAPRVCKDGKCDDHEHDSKGHMVLDPSDEALFQAWYADQVKNTATKDFKLDADPDAPDHHYDWRAAWQSGAKPERAADGLFHWPSVFKDDDHPNRFVTDPVTGKKVDTKYAPLSPSDLPAAGDPWKEKKTPVQIALDKTDSDLEATAGRIGQLTSKISLLTTAQSKMRSGVGGEWSLIENEKQRASKELATLKEKQRQLTKDRTQIAKDYEDEGAVVELHNYIAQNLKDRGITDPDVLTQMKARIASFPSPKTNIATIKADINDTLDRHFPETSKTAINAAFERKIKDLNDASQDKARRLQAYGLAWENIKQKANLTSVDGADLVEAANGLREIISKVPAGSSIEQYNKEADDYLAFLSRKNKEAFGALASRTGRETGEEAAQRKIAEDKALRNAKDEKGNPAGYKGSLETADEAKRKIEWRDKKMALEEVLHDAERRERDVEGELRAMEMGISSKEAKRKKYEEEVLPARQATREASEALRKHLAGEADVPTPVKHTSTGSTPPAAPPAAASSAAPDDVGKRIKDIFGSPGMK